MLPLPGARPFLPPWSLASPLGVPRLGVAPFRINPDAVMVTPSGC